MTENIDLKLWSECIRKAQQNNVEKLSSLLYSDFLEKPYVPPTLWRRIGYRFSTIKTRLSNAWDALKGDLDYDC